MDPRDANTGRSGATPATADLLVRRATPADAGLLARHRVAMFVDMGTLSAGSDMASAILAASERLFTAGLASGEWAAWIAEEAGSPIAGAAAILRPTPPDPVVPEGGTMAYVLNVYTEPAARRRGAARALMTACLHWCRERRVVKVGLHASTAGRRLYERLGFVTREGEMTWRPAAADPIPPPRCTRGGGTVA